MKAAVYRRYGPPDVVKIEEVKKPVPKDDEVLVKVRSASVNLVTGAECAASRTSCAGAGYASQRTRGSGVMWPAKSKRSDQRQLSSNRANGGALGIGAFAEYVCARESTFVQKPGILSFEEAACAPVAAFTALQGLRDE